MRIILGSGKRRQEWEVSPRDYSEKRETVNALLSYCGLPTIALRRPSNG